MAVGRKRNGNTCDPAGAQACVAASGLVVSAAMRHVDYFGFRVATAHIFARLTSRRDRGVL